MQPLKRRQMTEQLWRIYSDKVCHYFKRRMDKDELACDLMQDTFHKVLTNEDKLERIRNHEAWIFRIARNTLIDYTRKKKEGALADRQIPDDKADIEKNLSEIEEISECLQELIEEYTQQEQDILRDVFTKSLSQKEAAQALDIPYSTLKSRVQKARKEIHRTFKKRCCHLKYSQQGQIIGCSPV